MNEIDQDVQALIAKMMELDPDVQALVAKHSAFTIETQQAPQQAKQSRTSAPTNVSMDPVSGIDCSASQD